MSGCAPLLPQSSPLKVLVHLLLLVLALGGGAAHADWQIVQKGQHKEREEQITISIRGTLVRYDRPAKKLSWLTDVSTGDTILFVDEAKRYQRFTAQEVAATKAEQKTRVSEDMKKEGGKVARLEEKKSEPVAGWKTTGHIWSHPVGVTMKFWVATTPEALKIGEMLQKAEDANPLSAPLLPNTPRHGDFKGMIMRYELETSKGTSSKNTVLSVNELKLQGKMFEVPADYRELPKE